MTTLVRSNTAAPSASTAESPWLHALRPAVLVASAVVMCYTRADPDLWGHVRFGLDILHSGHVQSGADLYSFTQDKPFIYHEWLGGVIMAAAYRVGGTTGLMVLKAALVGALVGFVWWVARTKRFFWRWSAVALCALVPSPALLSLRPQLWTMLGIALLCAILSSQSRRGLWLLPPLFAAWANLHGGWVLGGALLVLWTAVECSTGGRRALPLLVAGAASLGATLLNPYGIRLWMFLLETVRLGRGDITEWQPIWVAGKEAIVLWVVPVVLLIISITRFGRPPATTLAILGFLAFASARVVRLGPLFVVTTLILLSRQWPDEEPSPVRHVSARALADLFVVGATLAFALVLHRLPSCVASVPSIDYAVPDTVASESLRNTHGTLVTSFNWGEYAIWHFGPQLKVSIDGRRETLYSDRTVKEEAAIVEGTLDGLTALRRLTPDYVWLPASSQTTAGWLVTHGYRQDVKTAQSFIAVRRDLPPLQAWSGTPSGCFPGP